MCLGTNLFGGKWEWVFWSSKFYLYDRSWLPETGGDLFLTDDLWGRGRRCVGEVGRRLGCGSLGLCVVLCVLGKYEVGAGTHTGVAGKEAWRFMPMSGWDV